MYDGNADGWGGRHLERKGLADEEDCRVYDSGFSRSAGSKRGSWVSEKVCELSAVVGGNNYAKPTLLAWSYEQ